MGGIELPKIQESAENYLETILVLKERNGSVRSVDIAAEMGFSKPSVSVAMKNLREQAASPWARTGSSPLRKKGCKSPKASTSATPCSPSG